MRFLTVCNNTFAPGLTVLIASLQRYFSGFADIPFRVLFDDQVSPLDPNVRTLLSNCFPNVEFVRTDSRPYLEAPVVNDQADNSAYLTIEAFAQTDCDRVIFLDADLLVVRDFSEILEIDHPFLACAAGGIPKSYAGPKRSGIMINTGVFVLGRQHLDGTTHERLAARIVENRHSLLRDQALINEIVPSSEVHILPDIYNFQAWDHLAFFARSAPEVRIVHFSGYSVRPKPWAQEATVGRVAYRMWMEEAFDALRRFPQLSPVLPFLHKRKAEYEEWRRQTRTALGLLKSIQADVEKDWSDIMTVHGDTTFNRVRALAPAWMPKLARRILGGTASS